MKTLLVGITFMLFGVVAFGQNTLPLYNDFELDVVGQWPSTTEPFQPAVVEESAGFVRVSEDVLGIPGKACSIYLPSESNMYAGSIQYSFVPRQRIAVECTVSVDRVMWSVILDLADVCGPSVARVVVNALGQVTVGGQVVGTYVPNVPFRLLVGVDMVGKNIGVVVDNELDGYEDDQLYQDLPFTNDPGILSYVQNVWFMHNPGGSSFAYGSSVAFDDIFIEDLGVRCFPVLKKPIAKGKTLRLKAEVVLGTAEEVDLVLYQYRPLGSSIWQRCISSRAEKNPVSGEPWSFLWDISLLPKGCYELRSVAYSNGDPYGDQYAPAVIVKRW